MSKEDYGCSDYDGLRRTRGRRSMTQSNQERAKARLEQYRQALQELQYYDYRIDTLRNKIMRSTIPVDQHAGWIGEYWGRSKKRGQGWIRTSCPEDLVNPHQIMSIPHIESRTPDPKGGEKLLVAMIDQQLEYEKRALEAMELCRAIEAEIDEYCDKEQASALKLRYIERLRHNEAMKIHQYSPAQWFRLIRDALERFGEKMRVNESK